MGVMLSKPPSDLREDFLRLKSRDDIARLLEIETKQLNFHLYVLPPDKRYTTFNINKKSGGTRTILAPISPIKIIQEKLKQILDTLYNPKPSTHGFLRGRSIVTNARLHKKRRYILNIDLENFFPTIHFGRVRGLFMGTPYHLGIEVATILAQICCHNSILPQGAPTSPVISNMICSRLDAQLQRLAKENYCTYSRYADDITFSTTRSRFPTGLANLSDIGQVELGSQLRGVIEDNGFKVNPRKTRLQTRLQRQEVTGLTVNRYPNIRRRYIKQVRAILHAWQKFGLDSTEQRYFEQYAGFKYVTSKTRLPPFQKVVLGKIEFIGMIKGRTNYVYLDLIKKFSKLAPEYIKSDHIANLSSISPFIYTEGKTDKKHIQAALKQLKSQGLFSNLVLDFQYNDDPEGVDYLLRRLEITEQAREPHSRPHIFIFDRDLKPTYWEKLNGNDDYKTWSNKVYSFLIPIPKHRENMNNICIEFYYSNDDLTLKDANKHRLYLSDEFKSTSGFHLQDDLVCKDINKLRGELKIIDNQVFDRDDNNVAMTKNDFADNVLAGKDNFANMDFSGFKPLFERIAMIISDFDSSL
jgi:RNA-directed DNA polymerase